MSNIESTKRWFDSKLEISGSSIFLCVVLFVNRMGAMTKMFFPLYLVAELGYGVDQAATLMSGYGLGLFAGAFLVGYLADIVPPKSLAIATFSGSAVFLAILAGAENKGILLLVLAAAGLCDSGANVLGQRILLDTALKNERLRVQALVRVGNNLGAACAGIMCGTLAIYDFKSVFLFDALCSLAAALILHRYIPRVSIKKRSDIGIKFRRMAATPYADAPFLTFQGGVLLIAMAYHALYFALGNFIIQHYGGSASDLGLQFSINAALIVIFQLRITNLAAGFPRIPILVAGAALLAVGFCLIGIGSTTTHLALSTVIWTAGEMILFPFINIETMKRAEGRHSGQYFGLAAGCWNSAALTVPLCIGIIVQLRGFEFIWTACTAACLIGTIFMLTGITVIRYRNKEKNDEL